MSGYEKHPFVRTGAELSLGERVADAVVSRFGSWRYIVIQTIFVTCWIAANVCGYVYRWDPYPFILLNLTFSTQAAYAAPLILLAQNRKTQIDSERDTKDYEHNRLSLQILSELMYHTGCTCDECEELQEDRRKERKGWEGFNAQ